MPSPLYTGKPFDEETGLFYFEARQMDPRVGRFISPDEGPFSLENPQSFGRYGYVANSPYRYADPDGKVGKVITGAVRVAGALWRGQDLYSTVSGIVESTGTIFSTDPSVRTPERLLATGSLLLELSGISDLKHLGSGLGLIDDAVEGVVVREAKEVTEGVYEFLGQSGTKYVGQSGDLSRRIADHARSGKLPLGAEVSTAEVLGGKTAREVAEQLRINELGGVRSLENIRNPIGPNRQHLLRED